MRPLPRGAESAFPKIQRSGVPLAEVSSRALMTGLNVLAPTALAVCCGFGPCYTLVHVFCAVRPWFPGRCAPCDGVSMRPAPPPPLIVSRPCFAHWGHREGTFWIALDELLIVLNNVNPEELTSREFDRMYLKPELKGELFKLLQDMAKPYGTIQVCPVVPRYS